MPRNALRYGVYDSVDHCWIGNSEGALSYDDSCLAQCAAAVVTEQMGWPVWRLAVAEFDQAATEFKDEIATLMTPLEAIVRIESRSGV